jgi:hypothetical protein
VERGHGRSFESGDMPPHSKNAVIISVAFHRNALQLLPK